MAHLFFEALSFPWWRPEAETLHVVLWQAISLPSEIDRRYKTCGPSLPPLTLNVGPDEIWFEALENLTSRACLKVLCTKLLNDAGFKQNAAFQSAVQAVIDARPDPTPLVPGGELQVPLLDRESLSPKVELLDNASGQKMIVVRGNRGTGRSHSRHAFLHAASARGAEAVYLTGPGEPTLMDVLRELFAPVDPTAKLPDGNTTDPAWYRIVINDLFKACHEKRKRLWIAVDDLSLTDPNIRLFFDQFALKLTNPTYQKYFRIMLIDYPPGNTPEKWDPGAWFEEVTSDADVKGKHVASFFTLWRDLAQRVLPDDDVTKYTEEVMEEGQRSDPATTRVQRISSKLRTIMAGLTRDVHGI